ncbi:dihydrodipicolinate synthase family protein [Aliivibrio fischeri]|uniref:dihydrodipicolinate synthase family protein n=1 Tax=Aliivibrio fischeri TaxID=668 RepID=UPI0007C5D5BB|nr:dihydrodipicolinate synthase family protein [Aliivibrio fischeri]MBP3141218.1 dihydrodipicolinate synthase family protein [Aliivibrio fischeri]MBP3155485.1 dihydrodipicolinate synthase family protein [Aliivibrio fischeri]MCE7537162.1 dihydrodipicolinate synthase family protein [Aliivibrio fischeri]MCE7555635.1 dihydrodipicolinate synthase family protein [Aliivibrio fischeri]MCE7559975.1 dihydrodipicolinate synthase family protein [Aliivibrio fischeri]
MKKLTGLIAAPHTPFDSSNNVNFEEIDKIAKHLIKDGVKGIYVCGTTGEGIHCSVEERKAIAERWVSASNNQLDIIVHTGALSIIDTLELTRHADTLDILATSAIGPCFFKPGSVADLVEYCATIAAAAPSKGFYYYHSGMSGVNLNMEEFLIQADKRIPNLSGLKFNSGDLYEYQRCLRACDGKFDIPFGVDEHLPGALAVGAKSAVGSTYNYAAPHFNSIIEAFNRGDQEAVFNKMTNVIELIRVLVDFGGVAAGKVAMELHDINAGDPRLPLMPLTAEQKVTVATRMRNAGFIQ